MERPRSKAWVNWFRRPCVAMGCVNHRRGKSPGLTNFLMPTDEKIRRVWLRLIGRDDLEPAPSSLPFWICALHFDPSDILVCNSTTGPNTRQLKTVRPGAVPSLQLPIFANVLTMAAAAADSETNALNLLISFHRMCDRLLCPDLASIVRAQASFLHFHDKVIKKTQEFKEFCINLFHTCPQAYIMLQKALELPPTRVINKPTNPLSNSFSDEMFSVLQIKVAKMSDKEKNCAILVGSRDFETNLSHNENKGGANSSKKDGIKKPVPGTRTVILMAQGILSNWTQPIAFRLFSNSDIPEEVFQWIHANLIKLICTGLKIRAVVLHPSNDFIRRVYHKCGTPEDYYFTVGDCMDKKIYFFYDVALLTKSVHNHLLTHNIYFEDRHIAKVEHLMKVYELDKTRDVKLAPQLKQRHVDPANTGQLMVHDAAKVFSEEVGIALCTYAHFQAIPESGIDTAQLILCISKLRDILLKKSFYGTDADLSFLVKMMNLFHSLKLFTKGGDMIEYVQFSEAFAVTIQSTLSLLEELKAEGRSFIKIKNLQLNAARMFLKRILKNLAKDKKSIYYFSRLNKYPTGGYRTCDFQKVLLDFAKISEKVHCRHRLIKL